MRSHSCGLDFVPRGAHPSRVVRQSLTLFSLQTWFHLTPPFSNYNRRYGEMSRGTKWKWISLSHRHMQHMLTFRYVNTAEAITDETGWRMHRKIEKSILLLRRKIKWIIRFNTLNVTELKMEAEWRGKVRKPPTQTYFIYSSIPAHSYACTYTKAPTHFIMSDQRGTSSRAPNGYFSSSPGLRAVVSWVHFLFTIMLYEQKLIIILFWYRCIACRGTI